MSLILLLKASAVWMLIAVLAVGNGVLRDTVVAPMVGRGIALPLSGIILSLIVIAATYVSFDFLAERSPGGLWLVGIQWVVMTLLFEFTFGHFVAGKTWTELLQTFNVLKGDLFTLVLLVSLAAPFFVAKWRGVL